METPSLPLRVLTSLHCALRFLSILPRLAYSHSFIITMPKETYDIVALPGDGIGVEVLHQALRVLRATGELFQINFRIEEIECGVITMLSTRWNGRKVHSRNAKRPTRFCSVRSVMKSTARLSSLNRGYLIPSRSWPDMRK